MVTMARIRKGDVKVKLRSVKRLVRPILLGLFAMPLLLMRPGLAQDETRDETARFVIGYLQLEQDDRYDENRGYARIQLRPQGRPFAGAEVGIDEAKVIGRVIKTDFTVDRRSVADALAVIAEIEAMVAADGIHFFMLDLNAQDLAAVSRALADAPVTLFNLTVHDDALRGAQCQANLVHMTPSYWMLTDGLAQYLKMKNWEDLLMLVGPLPADQKMAAAAERSADKFGLDIDARKPFELSNDPRIRERNNVALLTARGDYDIVYLVDTHGEFGRYVPYATNRPRPVVGTTGLAPEWWTWAWERHGAPQVNSRFEDHSGRRMTGQDWSAWVTVKALVQAVMRAKSTDYAPVRDYLRSEKIRIDGALGPSLNIRPWNGQLRIPILLATQNAVIERAPLKEFLHQTNTLDTLGADRPESKCQF